VDDLATLSLVGFWRSQWDPRANLEYFLLLPRDLEYLCRATYEAIANDVAKMRRMLNRLILKVQMEGRDGLRKAGAAPAV
jgi:hypothetical protein